MQEPKESKILKLDVYQDISQFDYIDLFWYNFFIEITALPPILISAFDSKILTNWYLSCINPVTIQDKEETLTFIGRSHGVYIQPNYLFDIDLNALFKGSYHLIQDESYLNKIEDDNTFFAIMLQIVFNIHEDDDIFSTQLISKVFEVINRLPISLGFYLFKLLIQGINKQPLGVNKLVSMLSYLQKQHVPLLMFEELREFYICILSLQFNAAKNGVTQTVAIG